MFRGLVFPTNEAAVRVVCGAVVVVFTLLFHQSPSWSGVTRDTKSTHRRSSLATNEPQRFATKDRYTCYCALKLYRKQQYGADEERVLRVSENVGEEFLRLLAIWVVQAELYVQYEQPTSTAPVPYHHVRARQKKQNCLGSHLMIYMINYEYSTHPFVPAVFQTIYGHHVLHAEICLPAPRCEWHRRLYNPSGPSIDRSCRQCIIVERIS